MLALTRHIAASYYSLKHGEWPSANFQSVDLKGEALGIVGLGPTGADMARLGAGVGMTLLGWTRTATADRARCGLRLIAPDQLFAGADVVTLHLLWVPRRSGSSPALSWRDDEAHGSLHQHVPS